MTIERDLKFGKLLSICKAIASNVFEPYKPVISEKNWVKYPEKPVTTYTKIHTELMEYTHAFGPLETYLFELFDEIIASMDEAEWTDEPLSPKYLLGYYQQNHSLYNVIGVEKAASILNLAPGTVKNMCADGKIPAKKVGKTWIIDESYFTNPS